MDSCGLQGEHPTPGRAVYQCQRRTPCKTSSVTAGLRPALSFAIGLVGLEDPRGFGYPCSKYRVTSPYLVCETSEHRDPAVCLKARGILVRARAEIGPSQMEKIPHTSIPQSRGRASPV